jgi:hypothetical protein
MRIDPSWFAKFTPERGGGIHEQFVVPYYTFERYREGRILHTSDPVFAVVGSWFWYRLPEFRALMGCATDSGFRALASVEVFA